MDLHYFHLEPLRGFHFGQRGVGVEATTDFAPSDTLFSALCAVLRQVAGKQALETMLASFKDRNPPFLLSGGFPYIMLNGKPLRFYPAPLDLQRNTERGEKMNKIRKARWLSEALFEHYLRWHTVANVDVELVTAVGTLMMATEYADLTREYNMLMRRFNGDMPLWVADGVTRVAVDRISNASNVYRAGYLTFVPQGGIWCAFEYRDPVWCAKHLSMLLDVLGDTGLGGERSSGLGQFIVHKNLDPTRHFSDVSEDELFVTLAYYAPRYPTEKSPDDETAALHGETAYGLEVRRGWMNSLDGSHLRRKAVRMVAIGSVLRGIDLNTNTPLYGQLVDVTPDSFTNHRVWRYGYALPLAIER